MQWQNAQNHSTSAQVMIKNLNNVSCYFTQCIYRLICIAFVCLYILCIYVLTCKIHISFSDSMVSPITYSFTIFNHICLFISWLSALSVIRLVLLHIFYFTMWKQKEQKTKRLYKTVYAWLFVYYMVNKIYIYTETKNNLTNIN